MKDILGGIARKVVNMETQTSKANNSPCFLIWIGGIAIIFFGTAGIAAILGWIPALMIHGIGIAGSAVAGGLLGSQIGSERGNDTADISQITGNAGVVVDTSPVEESVNAAKSYDITLLFENGLSSVIHEANPSAWRSGVRVKVVNSAILSKVGTNLQLQNEAR